MNETVIGILAIVAIELLACLLVIVKRTNGVSKVTIEDLVRLEDRLRKSIDGKVRKVAETATPVGKATAQVNSWTEQLENGVVPPDFERLMKIRAGADVDEFEEVY